MLKVYMYMLLMLPFGNNVRAMLDLTQMCHGKAENDRVAHPLDCQLYIDCAKIPEIYSCNVGQHFDIKRKVCDTPDVANCKLENSTAAQYISPFIAIDTDTGKSTQPLHKFNPHHVECVHFGAYYLPHPQLCNQYYLCAYGHLHQHSCGRGTLWHYEHEQCESITEAVTCYPNSLTDVEYHHSVTDSHRTTAVYEATVCYPLYTTALPSTATTSTFITSTENSSSSTSTPNLTGSTPNFASSTTEHLNNDTSTTTTWYLTGSTPNFNKKETSDLIQAAPHATKTTKTKATTTTTVTWHSTGSTPKLNKNNNKETNTHPTPHAPVTPTPPAPFSELVTLSSSSQLINGTTKRAIAQCPDSRQAYLPHPNDCSKYFICILGKAVLTTCPHGLYWDHAAESCDLAENVKCSNV